MARVTCLCRLAELVECFFTYLVEVRDQGRELSHVGCFSGCLLYQENVAPFFLYPHISELGLEGMRCYFQGLQVICSQGLIHIPKEPGCIVEEHTNVFVHFVC